MGAARVGQYILPASRAVSAPARVNSRHLQSRRPAVEGQGSRRYAGVGDDPARSLLLTAYHDLSRRISVAAFLPQAPITPPPGWLAAPHRYSPGTGVR